jgi:hypothetical protein
LQCLIRTGPTIAASSDVVKTAERPTHQGPNPGAWTTHAGYGPCFERAEQEYERRHVGKVVGYPPLSEMSPEQRSEFHEALLEADTFEDLPG